MGDGPTITGGTTAVIIDRKNIDDRKSDKGDMTTPPNKASFMKSGLEFFKETMSGLKGKSFMEKIEFIGERIALRKEQKAEFKEKMADYNLSLEKKAYMESLDRRDAEVAGVKDLDTFEKKDQIAWLIKDSKTPAGFGERVSTAIGSLLLEVDKLIEKETTGENKGKTFTREQAFVKIADRLVLECTAIQLGEIKPNVLKYIAREMADEGRTDKANLLKIIADKFGDATKPENAVRLFKNTALEHARTAGEMSFLRMAGGNDGITQKFLAFGVKASELMDSSLAIWDKTKEKEAYKTLETDLRSIIRVAVDKKSIESFNLTSVYPQLSEEGKKAVASLVKDFVADLKTNGFPETFKIALNEIQSNVVEGGIDVGSKVSSLFVSSLLKNATPSITNNRGLYTGPETKKEDKKEEITNEQVLKEATINDKVANTLATLISGVLTGAVNGGIADAKINTMDLANLQKDVLIPLGREVSVILTTAGMNEEGLKARTDLIDRHEKYIEDEKHLHMIASYSPPPPETGDIKNK